MCAKDATMSAKDASKTRLCTPKTRLCAQMTRPCAPWTRHICAKSATMSAGGRDHVMTVRGGGIAGDLGIDARAARQCVIEILEHDDATAARDHEAVTVGVKGA